MLTPNYILIVSLTFLVLGFFFIFFFLDGRFNVDIWRITIARHGKKLERTSWQMGSIVKKEKKRERMRISSQILKKRIDGDYQIHLKS